MDTIPMAFDAELKTKHGIDKLDFMIRFIGLLQCKPSKVRGNFNKLKSFLVSQLQRGISDQEEINLSDGCLKYIQSDPETNERSDAMKYLFELEFIE